MNDKATLNGFKINRCFFDTKMRTADSSCNCFNAQQEVFKFTQK